MSKVMYIQDGIKTADNANIQGTSIKIVESETGIVLFENLHNKVVTAGSIFTASKHFNIAAPVALPTYNSVLGLENSVTQATPDELTRVCLFAIGTDGCGVENSQVYPVNAASWITPNALIPFRYQLPANDLTAEQRKSYFGRKVLDNGMIAYYFKAFDIDPVIRAERIDGTPIDATIYDSTNTMEVQVYGELRLKVTKEDARDFFIKTTDIADARLNTISLLTGWRKVVNGFTYYQDIQPLTKLNIPNEALIDLTKGIDIIYHLNY